MRRTKVNRALTFVMAAALLIGSIHGVGAKEQSKAYDAPELTLTQGVTDYDLTEGITYDSEKYTLSVTDTGNFDVNVAGDYEISYALTEKESSVNVTESVENTESVDSVESIENIESTETVSGTETIETTDAIAAVEDTDQTPEGDATNTVDAQEKQVITFTRMVHVVAASEDEVPVYAAQELVLTQGEEDYDLTDDILYDDVKYTLTVGDLGGFDINKIGSYEVTYSLTPVTTEGTQGNEQNDTQENQVITFQRTVTVKPAGEENALYEAPDLTVFLGDEDYDLTDGITYDSDLYDLSITDLGGFDIYVPGDYEVSYELTTMQRTGSAMSENGSEGNASEASQDTEANTTASTQEDAGGSVTVSTSGTTVGSVSGGNAGAVVAAFSRTVSVVALDMGLYGAAAYVNGDYTVDLGPAIWTDDTHTKFSYPHVKVNASADIRTLTVTVSHGTLSQEDIDSASVTDAVKRSATWFWSGKTAEEVRNILSKKEFTYEA